MEKSIQIHSAQTLTEFVPEVAMHKHFLAIVKHRRNLPVLSAMEHGKIGFYVSQFERKSVIGGIALLIHDYLQVLSVSKKPEQAEVIEWARIIADEFSHFSLAEVAVFLEQCKRGVWNAHNPTTNDNSLYGAIDRVIFFAMWERYCEKRESLVNDLKHKNEAGPINPAVAKEILEHNEIEGAGPVGQKLLESEQNRREGRNNYPQWMKNEIELEEIINREVAEEAAQKVRERDGVE